MDKELLELLGEEGSLGHNEEGGALKKKKSGGKRKKTAWMEHLQKFYTENKDKMSYKEAMKEAKKTYKK